MFKMNFFQKFFQEHYQGVKQFGDGSFEHPKHMFKLVGHARIQKVLSEGSTFFFKLMRGERIQIPLYAGHHRPASETSFKWRFARVSMLAIHKTVAW